VCVTETGKLKHRKRYSGARSEWFRVRDPCGAWMPLKGYLGARGIYVMGEDVRVRAMFDHQEAVMFALTHRLASDEPLWAARCVSGDFAVNYRVNCV